MTGEQLRKSILQLAIQGRLVKQDPNDEPASALLEKIKQEKQKLIKEGKIKKDKFDSVIFRGEDNSYYEKIGTEVKNITDEIPFEIPENWEWCRIGSMCNIYTGNSINQNEKIKNFTNVVDGYNYIGTKDINFDRTINYKNGIRIPYDIENFRTVEKDTTIMCVEGGSAGRKISFTSEKICFGNKLCAFSSYKANSLYIFYYLQNPSFIDSFKSNTSGIIGGVSVNTIKTLLFPLPPLAEQQRIVEQINKLEPLIAEYDKLEKEESKLTSGLQEKLKKSILQYAIQGKLVAQDPNDEPASVLLEKIKAEKEKLIKEGKIKRDKNESFIYKDPTDNCYYEKLGNSIKHISDEIPFDIPENWRWVRFPNIVNFSIGKTPDRHISEYWNPGDFNWFSISDMRDRLHITQTKEKISFKALKEKFDNNFSPQGTLLMSFKLTVGRTSIIDIEGVHNEAIISIFPFINNDNIMRDYLFNFLGLLVKHVKQTDAIKGKTLNSDKMKNMLIPLPPLKEQSLILAKINKLFLLTK